MRRPIPETLVEGERLAPAPSGSPSAAVSAGAGRLGALVLIASSDAGARRWWSQGLGSQFSVEEVNTVAALKRRLARSRPSVLLVDLAMDRLGGATGLARLQQLSPRTRTVALAGRPNDEQAIAALRAGACGYSGIDVDSPLRRKTVEAVQKGEVWVSRGVLVALLRDFRHRAAAAVADGSRLPARRMGGLTSRQREVARLVGEGARNKDIAARMKIAEPTVKAHLSAIFRRLGVADRLRLALWMRGS